MRCASLIKLEFCFVSRLSPGSHVPSHSHPVLEIVYYAQGTGGIAFSGQRWDFSKNDFHIAPAGVAHEQNNTSELVAICVGVSGSGLEGLVGTWSDPAGELRDPMNRLASELVAKKASYELIAQGLLAQVVGLTRRVIQTKTSVSPVTSAQRIEKAMHIIRESEGKVSLASLSDTLYLSKDYLRHLVKKSTGQSPLRHIIASRMEKACRLLETTPLTVAVIAEECGFNDVYYFSKFFKRNAKLPPSAYRRQKQNLARKRASVR